MKHKEHYFLTPEQRAIISTRTLEALAKAKANGVKLGNTKNLAEAQKKGALKNKTEADEFARSMKPKMEELLAQGNTLYRITQLLNDQGVVTARGASWHVRTVWALIQRLKDLGEIGA